MVALPIGARRATLVCRCRRRLLAVVPCCGPRTPVTRARACTPEPMAKAGTWPRQGPTCHLATAATRLVGVSPNAHSASPAQTPPLHTSMSPPMRVALDPSQAALDPTIAVVLDPYDSERGER
jgi:hypothetical protein